MTKSTHRIIVVVNKEWEVVPLLSVLLSKKARPKRVPDPKYLNYHPINQPTLKRKAVKPRAQIQIDSVVTEIWCIQEIMDPNVSSSSTAEKWRIFPSIFERGAEPDVVIAFGTAGYPSPTSYNGCVVVGTQAFVYNPYKTQPNPESDWTHDRLGTLLDSSLQPQFFRKIDYDLRYLVGARFLIPPLNPARNLLIIAADNYTALSVVNITNYDHYAWADHKSLEAVRKAGVQDPIGSLETTHGVIRLYSEKPFLFVSGIADRIGFFNMEVTPYVYAQNFASAHNAGVTLVWLIPQLVDYLLGQRA